jgi:hypothetical protein
MAERRQYGSVERATRKQLSQAGISVQDSGLAAAAVILARMMDGAADPRESAAVGRELRMALAGLGKARPAPARSGLDELRARREARRQRG